MNPPAATTLLVGCTLLLAGCGGEGYLAHLVHGPNKVPAAYELADRPTLILVEDPAELFNDPNLPLTVAVNIEHHLQHNKVLRAIIPVHEVADLQAKSRQDYAAMPIDRIGQSLGAEQVVYVLIEDVALEAAPGMYRPRAVARVKVIDVATGRRLFPNPPAANQPASPTPVRGHPVVTELRYRGADTQSLGTVSQVRRQLAEILGRDIARLFHRWKPPEIGSRSDEP